MYAFEAPHYQATQYPSINESQRCKNNPYVFLSWHVSQVAVSKLHESDDSRLFNNEINQVHRLLLLAHVYLLLLLTSEEYIIRLMISVAPLVFTLSLLFFII